GRESSRVDSDWYLVMMCRAAREPNMYAIPPGLIFAIADRTEPRPNLHVGINLGVFVKAPVLRWRVRQDILAVHHTASFLAWRELIGLPASAGFESIDSGVVDYDVS